MAIAIYRIKSDYTGHALAPSDPKFWLDRKMFKLRRLRSDWEPPTFYVHNPVQAKDTDFHNVYIGILAFGKRVSEGPLGEILESCGEVLPAVREDTHEEFYIFNPLVCYNCLDRERTKLRTTPDGKVVAQVYEYAFHLERMRGESVFRIPETHGTELLASSGLVDPSEDFFHQYHEGGYTGLAFEKLWAENK